MKVLFISSGKNGGVSELIKAQGESLKTSGIEVDYYIVPSGFWSYVGCIPSLKKTYRKNKYDIAHAHYSYCAFVATLAGVRPLVVSLMGSDILGSCTSRFFSRILHKKIWGETIVKTEELKLVLGSTQAHVIPNGVNLDRFRPMDIETARSHIGFNGKGKLIVFISNPGRPEKNYNLAKEAVSLITEYEITLLPVFNVTQDEIPYYLNAADVFILTSKWEGSVNVIKEAMACNIPVVSTDVGDVKEKITGIEGCYIAEKTAENVARELILALNFNRRTKGRDRIIELGLDSKIVSGRIIDLYNKLLK